MEAIVLQLNQTNQIWINFKIMDSAFDQLKKKYKIK